MAVVHESKDYLLFKPVYVYCEQASKRQRLKAGERNTDAWIEKRRDSDEAAELPVTKGGTWHQVISS